MAKRPCREHSLTHSFLQHTVTKGFFLKFYLFNNFILFWLHWVSVAACGLSLAAASRGCSLAAFAFVWLLGGVSLVVEHKT